MSVLPLFAQHHRAAPVQQGEAVPAAQPRRRQGLATRLWWLLPVAALLGTPPDRSRVAVSEGANRCAAEFGTRQGEFKDVGGFRLLPSSERWGPQGIEVDLRARRNTAARPYSGGIGVAQFCGQI